MKKTVPRFKKPRGTYGGDTEPKKLARYYLYERIAQMESALKEERRGTAIVLSGDEAADGGPLRHMLRWTPSKTIFADTEKEALTVAHSRWPQVKISHGDVRLAIEKTKEIGLLNLDLMGYLNDDVVEMLEIARPRLTDGSFVSFTFARGREFNRSKYWDDLEDGFANLDERRFIGYGHIIQQTLNKSGKNFKPVFALRYRSSLAMGILTFQNVAPSKARRGSWPKAARSELNPGCSSSEIPTSGASAALRKLAVTLLGTRTVGETAEVLNVNPGAIKAWQAVSERAKGQRLRA